MRSSETSERDKKQKKREREMLPTEKKGRRGEDLKMKRCDGDARVDMATAEIRGELGGGSRTWFAEIGGRGGHLDGFADEGCILDHGKRRGG